MARGRHYAKLSLSNAARLSFSDLCILLFMFLSLCRLCVCVFLCSHWSLVDVPLIFFCPADHVPDWQPRVLLGMVEARSVNVKKTTTTTLSKCLGRNIGSVMTSNVWSNNVNSILLYDGYIIITRKQEVLSLQPMIPPKRFDNFSLKIYVLVQKCNSDRFDSCGSAVAESCLVVLF